MFYAARMFDARPKGILPEPLEKNKSTVAEKEGLFPAGFNPRRVESVHYPKSSSVRRPETGDTRTVQLKGSLEEGPRKYKQVFDGDRGEWLSYGSGTQFTPSKAEDYPRYQQQVDTRYQQQVDSLGGYPIGSIVRSYAYKHLYIKNNNGKWSKYNANT